MVANNNISFCAMAANSVLNSLNYSNSWWRAKLDAYEDAGEYSGVAEAYFASRLIVYGKQLSISGNGVCLSVISHLINLKHIDPKAILRVNLADYRMLDRRLGDIVKVYRQRNQLDVGAIGYIFIEGSTKNDEFIGDICALLDAGWFIFIASDDRSWQSFTKHKLQYFAQQPQSFRAYLDSVGVILNHQNFYLADSYFSGFLSQFSAIDLLELDYAISARVALPLGVKSSSEMKMLYQIICDNRDEVYSLNTLAKRIGVSVDSCKRYVEAMHGRYLLEMVSPWQKAAKGNNQIKLLLASNLRYRAIFCDNLQQLFENYLYLLVKGRDVEYIAADNLVFYVIDGTILLAPCYQGDLPKNALKVYDAVGVNQKYVIKGVSDILALQKQDVL